MIDIVTFGKEAALQTCYGTIMKQQKVHATLLTVSQDFLHSRSLILRLTHDIKIYKHLFCCDRCNLQGKY